jgi:hypothetical protein
VGDDLDFAGRVSGLDGDTVAEISRAVLDFNALGEEFLEGGEVEDLVGNGLCAVYGVLSTDQSVRQKHEGLSAYARSKISVLGGEICVPS